MGQLGGVLFAHPNVVQAGARFVKAPPAVQASSKRFHYCHNDIAEHNIVIKPDSLEVLSLIDWEFSGFFPPGFEVPFWRCRLVCGEWCDEKNGDSVDFESRRAMLKVAGKPQAEPEILEEQPSGFHPPAYALGGVFPWIKAHGTHVLSYLADQLKPILTLPSSKVGKTTPLGAVIGDGSERSGRYDAQRLLTFLDKRAGLTTEVSISDRFKDQAQRLKGAMRPGGTIIRGLRSNPSGKPAARSNPDEE
ncbi:MAG: hypothetical protein Q9170_006574 [Blastenia crenularia]